jgi:hypothetical protein
MPLTSGKRAFLEVLRQEGVEYLFGNPGTTELPLMDGLVEEPALTYVLALQEAAVVAMADGYAQASGKLGVVSVHVAPGLGNALGMLYDAQKAGAPLLVTAGQHDQSFNVTFTARRRPRWRPRPGRSSCRCRRTSSRPRASSSSGRPRAWRRGSAATARPWRLPPRCWRGRSVR